MTDNHLSLETVFTVPALSLKEFLNSLEVKESSKGTYERQLKEFFKWMVQHSLHNPTRQTITEYRSFLKDTKELSSLTIGGYLTSIRRFFEWLEATHAYPNIAKGIRGPRRKLIFKKDALSIDQVKKLLQSIDRSTLEGKRDYALINLMTRTGLRTIEVARATREDITRYAGAIVLWIHGKGRDDKDEFVVLTESAQEPVREYCAARGPLKESAPLFASHSTKNFGKRLTTRSISRIVKNRLHDIGIADRRVSAHSLRHTAITLSLLAGATPQEARTMARHADINTTLVYAHNINRIEQAPEHKIDVLLR